MPPRSRRRASQAPAPRPQESFDDDVNFEDEVNFEEDLDGTVDLSEYHGGDEVDFEAEAAGGDFAVDFADEDEDFESMEVEPTPARSSRATRSRRGSAESSDSARSARGRSARSERLAGASDRKKAAKSARKQAKKERTPEQIEARRRAMKSGIMLTLLMVVIIGAGIGFYYLFMRTSPERAEALAHLRNASGMESTLNVLINAGEPDQAEELINRVVADHLSIEMFGFASSPDPDPNNPSLISVDLARDAFRLRERFEGRLPEVQRIREDFQARANFNSVNARLSNLSAEQDLNNLRSAVDAFMDNPAYPERGPDLTVAARYRNQFVLPIRNQVVEIERERARRISAGTTNVVSAANQETDILMRDSRYGEALRLVDELARRHPDANLRTVRQKVLDSAAAAWASDKVRATNEWRIASDAGSASGDREAARERARAILHRVVTRYGDGVAGVDGFVREAQQLQQQFGF